MAFPRRNACRNAYRNASFLIGLIAASFAFVNCDDVKYSDCGPNNLQSVKITPCDKAEQCTFILGSFMQAVVEFVAPIDATAVSPLMKGVVRGKELVIPYQKEDPCNLGYLTPGCPIKKGEKYVFSSNLEIKPFYPAIPIHIKYYLFDNNQNTIFCAEIGGIIKDTGPKKARRRGG